MVDLLEVTDRLFEGRDRPEDLLPLTLGGPLTEVADGVCVIPGFGNVTLLDGDGALGLVDAGSPMGARRLHEQVRRFSPEPLERVVFTHGHIDHVFGVAPFDEEARSAGRPTPTVIAHERVPARFERYVATAGYNECVNRRQFGLPELTWPREYRQPDETYRDATTIEVGSLKLSLSHEQGETDDATVVWLADRRVLCAGDMFIWASPNCGNPQKVQRYPAEWAAGLRRMAALGAETMVPGHGPPIVGEARVRLALDETARYLESLVDQTLALMNAGARLDDAVAQVRAPDDLAERPYLRANYDEPEFVVRNIWRLYGGWWDGNPAELKPAGERAVAEEIAALAGGPQKLAERARALLELGDEESLRLAGHLVEWAWRSAPADPGVAGARREVYEARAARSTSTMARGVFSWAARESTTD